MKKIYSLLILPLIAVFVMAGCGDQAKTSQELVSLETEIVNEFNITNQDNTVSNTFFKEVDGKLTFDIMFNGDLEAVVNNTYSGTIPAELEVNYQLLNDVYQNTATLIFNYYSVYSDSFYENAKKVGVSEDDLGELHNKMLEFRNSLRSFSERKEIFEAQILTVGIDSLILDAALNSFFNYYNSIIKEMLDFVNYFQQLHEKHYFVDAPADAVYADMLFDKSLLMVGEYIYFDYLVSLEKNDTSVITSASLTEGDSNIYSIFSYSGSDLGNLVYNAKIQRPVHGSNVATEVENMKQEIENFELYYKLYHKVYGKVNKDDLNNYKFSTFGGFDDKEDYFKNLTKEEELNARVILDFEENKIYSFLTQISSL